MWLFHTLNLIPHFNCVGFHIREVLLDATRLCTFSEENKKYTYLCTTIRQGMFWVVARTSLCSYYDGLLDLLALRMSISISYACLTNTTNYQLYWKCLNSRAGSRHGQGWAKPTQMTVLPTQLELDKDCVIFFMQWLKPIWSKLYFEKFKI